eukprot:CAMPEP_0179979028 /NCGR_PEP_ID=MMETSP0983-20121128/41085_1 /TAXON_ID=483367 /ORGANISM="non described non described, Strain CCMP 2436" /LENGTH=65 /DNA_ID=CAMNT_0021896677 /DNA_START=25 /DNA_END=222 /DNA_ORIENTATION=+
MINTACLCRCRHAAAGGGGDTTQGRPAFGGTLGGGLGGARARCVAVRALVPAAGAILLSILLRFS